MTHVVFVAPFFMETTLRFIDEAAGLEGIELSLVSQDPASKLPASLAAKLSAHWRIDDGLDPTQIAGAIDRLSARLGAASRILATLEQLQVPVAQVREHLGIGGLSVEAARNFRDKARMKEVLRAAGVPCARHALVGTASAAHAFLEQVGFPVVVKPPAGAGGKATFRLDNAGDLATYLERYRPQPQSPTLFEEFMTGSEHSFESVLLDGQPRWFSCSRYMPSPLQVLEHPWMQWCVLLPRNIDVPAYEDIKDTVHRALAALGMRTGLSHTEWFRRPDGGVAISEIGARPPGAQFMTLLSYAHDLNFYRAWARLMVFDEFHPPRRDYAVGAAYVRGQGHGPVRAVHGLGEAQKRFGPLVVEAKLPRAGQSASDSYEGDGYVIMRHRDTAVIEDALEQVVQIVQVERG